jgi:hypothetical protein
VVYKASQDLGFEGFPLLQERCPPREKSKEERLKAKVEHLSISVRVDFICNLL